MSDELKPDPEIAAALRRLEGDVPLSAVDWDSLHRRIVRAAWMPAAVRIPPTWLDYTARWARAAIPLAAAALIALTAWLPGHLDSGKDSATNGAARPVSDREALTLALTGEATEHELVDAAVTPRDSEWLVSGVLGSR